MFVLILTPPREPNRLCLWIRPVHFLEPRVGLPAASPGCPAPGSPGPVSHLAGRKAQQQILPKPADGPGRRLSGFNRDDLRRLACRVISIIGTLSFG